MNDEQINSMAEGIFMFLRHNCPEPSDAMGVLTCLALLLYEKGTTNLEIERYADDFKASLIHFWNTQIPPTETRQ